MWFFLNAGPTLFIPPKTGSYLKACVDRKRSAHMSSCVPTRADLQAWYWWGGIIEFVKPSGILREPEKINNKQ